MYFVFAKIIIIIDKSKDSDNYSISAGSSLKIVINISLFG